MEINNCPDCKSTNIREFKNGCTLLNGAGPHYICTDCQNLWAAEYIVQRALGTLPEEKPTRISKKYKIL